MNYLTNKFNNAWQKASLVDDTKIIFIDSQIAEELLKVNFNNRTLKVNIVKQIVSDIENDRWALTHQSIGVDVNGHLIDGQHRLTAIKICNESVPVRVTINCEPKTMDVVDIGKSRSNADMLTMAGHPNARNKAAVIRQIICYKEYPHLFWQNKEIIVSAIDIKEKIAELEASSIGVDEVIKFANFCSSKFRPLVASCAGSFLLLCKIHDFHDALSTGFIEALTYGENLPQNSPIKFLRTKWINATKKMYPHAIASQIKLAEMIMAYKLYVKNATITRKQPLSFPPMPKF